MQPHIRQACHRGLDLAGYCPDIPEQGKPAKRPHLLCAHRNRLDRDAFLILGDPGRNSRVDVQVAQDVRSLNTADVDQLGGVGQTDHLTIQVHLLDRLVGVKAQKFHCRGLLPVVADEARLELHQDLLTSSTDPDQQRRAHIHFLLHFLRGKNHRLPLYIRTSNRRSRPPYLRRPAYLTVRQTAPARNR